MKKTNILLIASLMTTALFAGGDVVPVPKELSKNKTVMKPFKTKKMIKMNNEPVYIEDSRLLMWQDEEYSNEEIGAYKRGKTYKKVGSVGYANKYCKKLKYNGFTDWRLPKSDELMKVYYILEGYRTRKSFKNNEEGDFWSSTQASEGKHYMVYSKDGFRYEKSDKTKRFIRCVRDNK